MAKLELNIIHFNDVYDIRERTSEPVGGVARFATAVKSFSHLNPIVLFSGDVFNPSIMSSITKGKHMVSVMHQLNVACSVVGNHEFDFGVDTLTKYIGECKFPWLLSNVNNSKTGEPLVGSKRKAIIEWNGVKIGLIGLAEQEWLDTVKTVLPDVDYIDYVKSGTDFTAQLKAEGADIVIVLAHMRSGTAQDVAAKVPGVDLVLNGHDHFYEIATVKGIKVITSGVDFRDLSVIKCVKNPGETSFTVEVEEVHVTKKYEPDAEMQALADSFSALIDKKMLKVIGETSVVLDAKNETVRTRESNLGNLVADIMKAEMKTNIAFINGGSLRSDNTYGPGPFIVADLMNILPYANLIVSFSITGATLKQVLETGVGKWPEQVGRFPQLSGVSFTFDPSKPEGSRVQSVEVDDEPLDLNKRYSTCTTLYIAQGNDGFNCLGEGNIQWICNEENGILLNTIVRRYFIRMRTLQEVGQAMRGLFSKVTNKTVEASGKHLFTVGPEVEGRIVNLAQK